MRTDFLFAQPSLLIGLARLVDLYGLLDVYNGSHSEKEADARGLYSDFRVTGEDIARAIDQAKAEDTEGKAATQIPLFSSH